MLALFVYVPTTHADQVRQALHKAGAGAIGDYDSCAFIGTGQFRPLPGSHPAVGAVGLVEHVDEVRIETIVSESIADSVVTAVKAAHPYEQPGIHLMPLKDVHAMEQAHGRAAPAAGEGKSGSTSGAHPVRRQGLSIVLEGLDGVGKSTTALSLARRLGAVHMITPTPRMRQFRSYFDTHPAVTPEVRHGYYMTGNFLAGLDMRDTTEAGASVVLDRYYASTNAYVLGKKGELPPPGDEVYAWPAELPKPDIMVLLTLPESERLARRAGRTHIAETPEEALLASHLEITARINEAYRRYGCVEVSAQGGVEDVVDRIMDLVKARQQQQA